MPPLTTEHYLAAADLCIEAVRMFLLHANYNEWPEFNAMRAAQWLASARALVTTCTPSR